LDKNGVLQIIARAPELRTATGSFESKWGIVDEECYEVYPHIAGVDEVIFALLVGDNYYDYGKGWFGLIQYKARLNTFQRAGIFLPE
jgi:hypothetical protein